MTRQIKGLPRNAILRTKHCGPVKPWLLAISLFGEGRNGPIQLFLFFVRTKNPIELGAFWRINLRCSNDKFAPSLRWFRTQSLVSGN
jgi:hypothetical protein